MDVHSPIPRRTAGPAVKIEIKPQARGGYALDIEGEWFDDFDDLEHLLNAVYKCQLMLENPMTADFMKAMIRAKVSIKERTAAPGQPADKMANLKECPTCGDPHWRRFGCVCTKGRP